MPLVDARPPCGKTLMDETMMEESVNRPVQCKACVRKKTENIETA